MTDIKTEEVDKEPWETYERYKLRAEFESNLLNSLNPFFKTTNMEEAKTENLTITITDIPSELMDLLWKAMDKTAKQKYDESVKRTSQMSFDFYEMEDNAVTKLIGTAISMHFTQLIKNK